MFEKNCIIFLLTSCFVITHSAHFKWIDSKNRANECQFQANGTLINDPSSCAGYFLCVDGTELSLNCPDSLQFNPIHSFCDTQDNVQCEEPVITTPNPICIGEEHFSFINNEASCAAYFLCYNEVAIEINCPPPLHFDPEINDCNLPKECVDEITPPPQNALCDNVTNGAYINDETSCAAYFVCLSGVPLGRNCPDGFYFNPSTNFCDKSSNVECEDITNICDGQEDFTFVNNPDGCADYFVCIDEIEFPAVCPHPLIFNPDTQVCDNPQNVDCEDPNVVCLDKPNGALVNDNTTCAAYFFCINDQAISAACPDPLHFDPVNEQCIHQNYSSCVNDICLDMPDRTVMNDPSSCAAYFLCFSQESINLFCPTPLYFNPDINSCDFPENVDCDDFDPNALCRDVANMDFVADPNSCANFYHCINGIAFSGQCPYPWLFNSNISACDIPENVDCGNTGNTTTTTEATTPGNTTTPTTETSTLETPTTIANSTTTDYTTTETTTTSGNTTVPVNSTTTDHTTTETTTTPVNSTTTDYTSTETTTTPGNSTTTDYTTTEATTTPVNSTTTDYTTTVATTTPVISIPTDFTTTANQTTTTIPPVTPVSTTPTPHMTESAATVTVISTIGFDGNCEEKIDIEEEIN